MCFDGLIRCRHRETSLDQSSNFGRKMRKIKPGQTINSSAQVSSGLFLASHLPLSRAACEDIRFVPPTVA